MHAMIASDASVRYGKSAQAGVWFPGGVTHAARHWEFLVEIERHGVYRPRLLRRHS